MTFFLTRWSKNLDQTGNLKNIKKLRLLSHYAENDAYPEWVFAKVTKAPKPAKPIKSAKRAKPTKRAKPIKPAKPGKR